MSKPFPTCDGREVDPPAPALPVRLLAYPYPFLLVLFTRERSGMCRTIWHHHCMSPLPGSELLMSETLYIGKYIITNEVHSMIEIRGYVVTMKVKDTDQLGDGERFAKYGEVEKREEETDHILAQGCSYWMTSNLSSLMKRT